MIHPVTRVNHVEKRRKSMKIGISGPILIETFKEYLETTELVDASGVKGLGGTSVNTLAQGLLERGHELVLFSMDTEASSELVLDGNRLRICMGPYRSSARRRALDFFRLERKYIQHAIEREKPDIVHAHWTYEFALGALASGVPTLVTVRDWAPAVLARCRNPKHAIYRFIRYLMDRQTFKHARRLSANSALIQERIKKRWSKEVPIIPNAIEDSLLLSDEKLFPSDVPRIISISNGMSELKNQKTLLRAVSLIRREIPECSLQFAGYHFEPGGIAEQWARENGLNAGVEYLGALERDEIMTVLDEASLMIHPSLEESFGNVLLEAMARRVPVLGGESSGAVPWVLDYGRAGALCDVSRPESIAREAIEILTSHERRAKLSIAGYARIREAFSISSVVDLCLTEYKRVIREGKKELIRIKPLPLRIIWK